MNYFEARIAQDKRRLDRIRANPDHTKLHANEIFYEMEMEDLTTLNEAWKRGDLLSASMDQISIFAALGFRNIPYLSAGNNSGVMKKNYFDILRKHGYPDQSCDMTTVPLAMVLEGDVPWPHMVAVWNHACDREGDMLYTAISTACGCTQFKLDAPLSADYDTIHYMSQQLGELIEFTERKFNVKMNWEDLEHRIAVEKEITKLMRQQYELRKKVPSPISGQDVFRLGEPREPQAALNYWLAQTEEVAERAAKGIGSVVNNEEKLRIAWLATGPFGSGVFDMLHKRGVSIPWFQHGFTCNQYGFRDYAYFKHYSDETEFKCKLNVLEEISRKTAHNGWGGRGLERWVRSVTEVCRDLRIDAVVQFLHTGCVTVGGLAQVTKEILESQLGIPVLNIQGRQNDWDAEKERDFQRGVNEFIDMCLEKKK